MRILFTTHQTEAPSTKLNLSNLQELARIDGVTFSAFGHEYEGYDLILFMGYDPDIASARHRNPSARIGVVDPRPGTLKKARGADFVLSNGPEMSCMALPLFTNIFEYPIYPHIVRRRVATPSDSPLVLTYHGNRDHITCMNPVVTTALDHLANELSERDLTAELHLIYDVRGFGRVPERSLPRSMIVRHIQWHEHVYEQEFARADIGLVPNLIPIRHARLGMCLMGPWAKAFGAHPSDMLLRFKPTSNPGRILAFAQHGIPLVADLFPSSASVVRNGVTGYIALDAAGWYQALRRLCLDAPLRERLGKNLRALFDSEYSTDVINHRLLHFVAALPPDDEIHQVRTVNP